MSLAVSSTQLNDGLDALKVRWDQATLDAIRLDASAPPVASRALAMVSAAVFDAGGVLRRLGVRLVPSNAAEAAVDAFGGTRHTSGRRYSYDDPLATVIAVSEDGPVSVLRNGDVLGRSHDGD